MKPVRWTSRSKTKTGDRSSLQIEQIIEERSRIQIGGENQIGSSPAPTSSTPATADPAPPLTAGATSAMPSSAAEQDAEVV
jgi:hypothetical protein